MASGLHSQAEGLAETVSLTETLNEERKRLPTLNTNGFAAARVT
jgi:hypothetical protein